MDTQTHVADRTAAHELIGVAHELRLKFALTAATVDASGAYPTDNMNLIHAAGLDALCFPEEWGGLASAESFGDLVDLDEILTELAAGESSTAQIWFVHQDVVRSIFAEDSVVSEVVKKVLHRQIKDEGARFCAPAAEPNKKRFSFQMPCRKVKGGVVIDGTKFFATGSEGARYGLLPVLLEGYPSVEEGGLYFVLVDLQSDGVVLNHDWDNMGQRATGSGSITFNEVFVPDGFHWAPSGGYQSFYGARNISGPALQTQFAAIILGIGLGAFDAMRTYVKERVRPSNPEWPNATHDPVIRWQAGQYSAMLSAGRALNREAARAVVDWVHDGGSRSEVSAKMIRAKVTILEAALKTAGELHRLGGGGSTSNRFRFDMYWRNARTLSTHDSQDIKLQQLGAWELAGDEMPVDFVT
jgi:alkylation response protein AidB-like acyl-CoA dehydrogenase